jgi:hypothetical protein
MLVRPMALNCRAYQQRTQLEHQPLTRCRDQLGFSAGALLSRYFSADALLDIFALTRR